MARPSEALLGWLRDIIKSKGLNTAAVAETSGLARARVRRILSGADDMTVDELMLLSDALKLDPADLSAHQSPPRLPSAPARPAAASGPAVVSAGEATDFDDDGPDVDPWGNQPRQLFQVAFALGCDFVFLVATDELEGSGVPGAVLEKYRGRELPIRLDAAYHKYNEPRYHDDGITLTLSFDALYECTFPWATVKQFVLFPIAPEPTQDADPPSDEAPATTGVPHLRLVT